MIARRLFVLCLSASLFILSLYFLSTISGSPRKALQSLTEHRQHRPQTIFSPAPCRASNDFLTMSRQDFSKWKDHEIDNQRAHWHAFLSHDFPVNYKSYNAISRLNTHSRGIVYTAIPSSMWFLLTSITILRDQGCTLPIEVWHFQDELNSTHIAALKAIDPSISIRVAESRENIIPIEKGGLKGAGTKSPGQANRNFHIKIAAIINSHFEDVLSLDVDIMPLRNPEYMFDTVDFINDGAVFWPDYWKTGATNPVWSWMGVPCVDEWEQESGIILINRKKSWKALHLAYFMNRNEDMRYWRRFIHGDKDTFRFSWRATGTKFTYTQKWLSPGGFEHGKGDTAVFCGNTMIQHDLGGNMLFLHTNLFKELDWNMFSEDKLPLTHLKRYKKSRFDVGPIPVGNEPGTLLSFYYTRGYKARFNFPRGLQHSCVDLAEGLRDGVDRRTEVVALTDNQKLTGTPDNAYLKNMFKTMTFYRNIFPPPPVVKKQTVLFKDNIRTPVGEFGRKQEQLRLRAERKKKMEQRKKEQDEKTLAEKQKVEEKSSQIHSVSSLKSEVSVSKSTSSESAPSQSPSVLLPSPINNRASLFETPKASDGSPPRLLNPSPK